MLAHALRCSGAGRVVIGLAVVVADWRKDDLRDRPGAGAAGGLGFGLMAFCGAEVRRGFDEVAELLRLAEVVAGSDLVITGEGSLDAQTLTGMHRK
jgi:glycerate kinase